MSNARISDSLSALFAGHPIVFWHDVEAEFSGFVDTMSMEGVQLIRMDEGVY